MLAIRWVRGSAAIAMLAGLLTACSEGPTAPQYAGFDRSDALMAKGGSGNGAPGLKAGSRSFTIWPGAATFEKFGDHTLYIPANVTCDPATSGYSSAHWDAPCARATEPIKVTATWTTINNRPVIGFSPDLRFAPSSQESHWVILALRDTKSVDPERYYAILWFDREAGKWVDESKADPTLEAQASLSGNLVTRRLKHFSEYTLVSDASYNVTSGIGDGFGIGTW